MDRESEVRDANQAFYRAFNQKDVAAMDAIWARTAEVGCIHPGWNVLWGRTAVMQSWERILTNPDQPKVVAGGESVSMTGDVAVVTCRELVAGTRLAATNVFICEGGIWKIFHHHSGQVLVPDQ